MASRELQKLVKKIFGDEPTRREFEKNPDGVLTQFGLSDQEKRAVLKLHDRVGTEICSPQQLEAALDPNIFWDAPIPAK